MVITEYLKELFRKKLEKTGSLDAAFTKAVWVAYNKGLEDGRLENQEKRNDATIPPTT